MLVHLTTLLGLVVMVSGVCVLEEQENNFMASRSQKTWVQIIADFNKLFRLEGNWTFNPTVSELLTGDSKAGGFLGQMIVGFSNQSEVNI
mgnify:CR=1 FL=1